MKKSKKSLLLLAIIVSCFQVLHGQADCDKSAEPGMFDMGKMWTFDFPPEEYFGNTYNFKPDQAWFEEARLSALRFADYCSASFVSANGLVMTNHHCARESGVKVQRKGENFNENSFYAPKLTDERKVEGLFVDQLVKIEDITDRVLSAIGKETTEATLLARERELNAIKKEYAQKPEWTGLELQTIQFYYGSKYSLYGFRRYNDVRLVFMPEIHLGFFGGDYDNFTYPRYDLDCSFFRVYDDSGKPLKTDHYFKFSANGADEGDAVFVIGNPGSTSRMSTISDLEFIRDMQLPLILDMLKKVSLMYQEYNKKAQSDSLTNLVFEYENSWKALNGQYEGLKDPCIMARKAAFEAKFKNDVKNSSSLNSGVSVWDEIQKANEERKNISDEFNILVARRSFSGELMQYAFDAVDLAYSGKDSMRYNAVMNRMAGLTIPKELVLEQQALSIYLQAALEKLGPDHPFVEAALDGKTPDEAARSIITTTKMADPEFRNDLLTKDSTAIRGINDPLLKMAAMAVPVSNRLMVTYRDIQARLFAYHRMLGKMLFEIYGTQIPPDATFSLRINDGVVKGYDYNGTIAPPNTTFFGLYDRYYSFDKKYPFFLPKKWENPPMELLKTPMDFVTTNDIIGGNSGSPVVNKNLEVVGLVFDGNIESLPGSYIFIPDKNRAVSVHSAGIMAALRYIYKTKRLVSELSGK